MNLRAPQIVGKFLSSAVTQWTSRTRNQVKRVANNRGTTARCQQPLSRTYSTHTWHGTHSSSLVLAALPGRSRFVSGGPASGRLPRHRSTALVESVMSPANGWEGSPIAAVYIPPNLDRPLNCLPPNFKFGAHEIRIPPLLSQPITSTHPNSLILELFIRIATGAKSGGFITKLCHNLTKSGKLLKKLHQILKTVLILICPCATLSMNTKKLPCFDGLIHLMMAKMRKEESNPSEISFHRQRCTKADTNQNEH
jgi:hypothetical protein